jgi:hypothetical protein
VNPTGGGGRRGAHQSVLAAARNSAAEKESTVEQTKGHRVALRAGEG